MGFFTNLKSALESKRNNLGKVNTFLTNSDWSQTQRRLDELEEETTKVFVYNPEVVEHESNANCKGLVDDYKAEVISIKADCTKEMSEAVTMVNYTKCDNANDFKEVCNQAVDKAEKTIAKAKSDMDKASVSALKKIADKIKSLSSIMHKPAGIDLSDAYNKKKEYEEMHKNLVRLEEETRYRANKEGHLKTRNEIISNISSMKKDVKTVKESQEFDEYLKKIPLDILASINKKLHEAEIGYMLESDGKGRDATVTEQQLERQRQKVQALKTEVDDKIAASRQALEIQRDSIKKFDDIRKNPDVLNSYSIVDMQRLGLIASQSVARQNCIVMMSPDVNKAAVLNGKADYPAVIVVDHDGTVHAYDTFAKCDEAKHIGVSDPNKAKTLQMEGNMQNTTEYSLNGQMEAYVNFVRDYIKDKDKEHALQSEYERAVHGGPNVVGVSQQYLDYQRMAKEREAAEALSNFMFDSNWDFIKDASSKVQAQMAPLIINIKREMEAREDIDKDQLLTGTVLRDKTQLVNGENGQEFAPVLVLSASMSAIDKVGEPTHPTINVVCDEKGHFQSAYYSEEYHDTSCAYLGQKIADTTHGIDYSLYSNNPTVRDFLEAYPSIKQTIEQNCELSKFYDDRNITLEDVKKAQEEVELEQE